MQWLHRVLVLAVLAMATSTLLLPMTSHSAALVAARAYLLRSGYLRVEWEDDCATQVVINRVNTDGSFDVSIATLMVAQPGAYFAMISDGAPIGPNDPIQFEGFRRIGPNADIPERCWVSPILQPIPLATYLPGIVAP